MVSKYSLEKIPVEVELDWGRDKPWSSGHQRRVLGAGGSHTQGSVPSFTWEMREWY